jgi:phosphomannomutase
MIKFGTGGWRAVIGEDFTKANVQLLTATLCGRIREEGLAGRGLCVGYDRRFLSRQAAQWVAEVCAGAGVACRVLAREAPTPLIMFTVRRLNLPYGLAVTASHNRPCTTV